MQAQNLGQLELETVVRATPDYRGRGLIASLYRSAALGLSGQSGGVIGDDRGSSVHSFSGPMAIAPLPVQATYAGGISMRGAYRPVETLSTSVLPDPTTNPTTRVLWNRLRSTR